MVVHGVAILKEDMKLQRWKRKNPA